MPRIVYCTLWILLSTLAVATKTQAANERALWQLWQQHTNAPTDHAAVIATCEQFTANNPRDPLVIIADSLRAWHLLKDGRRDAGLSLYKKHLARNATPLEQGANAMAKAWLSFADLAQVRTALKQYYREEVAFPPSLTAIGEHPEIPERLHPPLHDRWGTAWQYRLVGFHHIHGLKDQKYALSCVRLPDVESLEDALKAPYANRIYMTPKRLVSQGERAVVLFANGPQTLMLGLGSRQKSSFLAYVGTHLVVVCDWTHWAVFAKPNS